MLTTSRAPHNLPSSTTGQVFKSPLFYSLSILPGTPVPTSRFLPAYFSMLGMMFLYSLMNVEEGGSSSCLGWTVKHRDGKYSVLTPILPGSTLSTHSPNLWEVPKVSTRQWTHRSSVPLLQTLWAPASILHVANKGPFPRHALCLQHKPTWVYSYQIPHWDRFSCGQE